MTHKWNRRGGRMTIIEAACHALRHGDLSSRDLADQVIKARGQGTYGSTIVEVRFAVIWGLISKPSRSHYRLTDKGRAALEAQP